MTPVTTSAMVSSLIYDPNKADNQSELSFARQTDPDPRAHLTLSGEAASRWNGSTEMAE